MTTLAHRLQQRADPRHGQRGSTAVEFALVSVVFFTIFFGAFEIARLMFYWNSAAEATRLGSRVATVCDLNATAIQQQMIQIFPNLQDVTIDIDYVAAENAPGACDSATIGNCGYVTLSLQPAPFRTLIPFSNIAINIPPFTTTLTTESLRSLWPDVSTGGANPVCAAS
jgi:hypothetical protein